MNSSLPSCTIHRDPPPPPPPPRVALEMDWETALALRNVLSWVEGGTEGGDRLRRLRDTMKVCGVPARVGSVGVGVGGITVNLP